MIVESAGATPAANRERALEPIVLLGVAEQSWRKLNEPELMREVYDGKRFKDGIAVETKTESTRKAA